MIQGQRGNMENHNSHQLIPVIDISDDPPPGKIGGPAIGILLAHNTGLPDLSRNPALHLGQKLLHLPFRLTDCLLVSSIAGYLADNAAVWKYKGGPCHKLPAPADI